MAYRRTKLMSQRIRGNRERIVAAARSCIAAGGYRAATVQRIAAAAGVSTGAIYRHFPSKSSLFVRVLGEAVRAEIRVLREVSGAGRGNARERLAAAVGAFVRRALAGPRLAHAFIAEPVDPKLERARLRYRRAFGAVFEALVREGIERGELPPQDPQVAAACIVGAFTEALVGPTAPASRDLARRSALEEQITGFCMAAVGRGAGLARRAPGAAGRAAAGPPAAKP